MDKPKKARSSRPVKAEVATPEVAPQLPAQETKKYPDKPTPDARPKKVYKTESGLTIEEY
jgi:hypothetical protein